MGKRFAGKRGQAFVEYLVIIVLVIAALLGVRALVGNNLTNTYGAAGNQTNTMAANVAGATPE
jgi:Flp pilus assembly pilin Flp